MSLKLPQAFLEASATVSEVQAKVEASKPKEEVKVHARIDMSAEVAGAGLCPECRQPMEPSLANGIPVLVCLEHRIAIPTPDAPEVVDAKETN
jgi:hypothetical protein